MITAIKRIALFGSLLFAFVMSANATDHRYKSSKSLSKYSSYHHGLNKDLRPRARSDRYIGEVGKRFKKKVKRNDFQGNRPARFRIIRGKLPSGLKLRSNGKLVGTPTEAGTFIALYKLRDRDGDRSYAFIKIRIKEQNLIPEAQDDEYSAELGAEFSGNVISDNDTQGDGTATAELTGGELPPGLTLNADGSITGTATASGVYTAEYTITDANGDTASAFITITIQETITYCPQPAISDDLHGGSSTHAITIPKISGNLQFVGTPTVTRVFPNGDMTLSGTVADGDIQFDVAINYSGYTATSDSPKLELKDSAYLDNGGPIDPSTWEFFSEFSATFTGVGGAWDGVVMTAELRGPMAQIGVGANGKNGNFGLANWFDVTIESATNTLPGDFFIGQVLIGDVNIDLPDECPRMLLKTQCSIAATPDAYSKSEGSQAILISNIPDRELVFETPAVVEVFDNGDITVTGTVVGTYSGAKLDILLEYTNASDTSPTPPKRDLIRSAYSENGGPVDTSTWTYFESFKATFTGVAGDATFDGVVFDAVIKGELPQLGFGASGKNINFGLSNWFDVTVTDAPETGSRFSVGDTFTGDVNININEEDGCDVVIDDPTVE